MSDENSVKGTGVFKINKGMPLAVWQDKYARRKEDGTFQTWEERVTEVLDGNFSLDPRQSDIQFDANQKFKDYEKTLELAKKGVMIFSGRHLQHGDKDQKHKMGELYTNCSTAMFSFIKFWLLLKGSGVGRCYDNDICFVNWDFMPNTRFVLSQSHPDYNNKIGIESLEEAQHKYDSDSEMVRWFTVEDSGEGWVKVIEILETAAFHKNNKDHLFIFDFSQIRPFGAPIKGQQGRPASGPVPFIQALQQVATVKNAGWKPWKQALFIDHYLSSCVAVGGIRRSARIATKFWKDKDIFEFIDIKRGGWLYTANNSITVDEEFWRQAESPKPTHGRRVFEYAVSASYHDQTGEPGFINIDKLSWNNEGIEELNKDNFLNPVFREKLKIHHKTIDMIGYHIEKVKTKKYPYIVNPCQPEWASLITPHGITQLKYTNIGDKIWTEVQWSTVTNKQATGIKKVYKYETTAGTFYGTRNHKLVSNGVKIEAKDCEFVDCLRGPNIKINQLNPYDIMDGLVIGDGSVHKASNNLVHLYIGKDDYDYHESEISHLISKHRPGIKDTAWEVVTSVTPEELPFLKIRKVPKRFYYAKPETVAGFLKGLYSANGSICGNRVTLKSSSKDMIEQVQHMLSSLGIKSYYTTNNTKENTFSNGTYCLSESYDLNISTDRNLFAEKIGFLQKYKTDKLNELLKLDSREGKSTYEIISIELVSEEMVYSITVDNQPHTYWTGGLNVSNCGEIVLGVQGGYCVIGDICLANCETLDDAREAARLMAQFLIRSNTMDFLYDYEVKRTNRIGVSLTGIHEFAFHHFNLNFYQVLKNKELKIFLTELNSIVKESADKYSYWVKLNPPHTYCAIKPSGTVSKVMGCTEGAHLPAMAYYMRWVQFPKQDPNNKEQVNPKVQELMDRGYPMKDISLQYKDHVVIGFPTKLPIADLMKGAIVTASDVEPYEQYQWIKLLEDSWLSGSNNQVSYTLKYNQSRITQETYSRIILNYQRYVKCCAIMPQEDKSAYIYTPEEELSEFEYNEYMNKINRLELESYDEETLMCEGGACPIEGNIN